MFKIDLHTHSEASKDGGITAEQYAQLLANETLDYIAITDHNRIDFALGIKQALGEKIIVGEEISTAEGDLIGLYLHEYIPEGLSLEETVAAIRAQHGLVYVPHPFETVRQGIQQAALERIAHHIDIVEVYNGRAVQATHAKAVVFARQHGLATAASSDAHSLSGIGKTYTIIQEKPAIGSLEQQLFMPRFVYKRAPLLALLAPKKHRLLKALKGYSV